ncbi:MAG: iron ABC transporter permease [Actinomycetota bacterium]|nr:MAG: iron ABC transporter permease [Actinomycetota bacterium]
MRRLAARAALAAPLLAFLGLFFVYPVVAILDLGLRPHGVFTPSILLRPLVDPGLRGVVAFTIGQALASTALTLAIGLPAALVLSRFRFPGRRALRTLVVMPFVLPTVVVASAFIGLLGPAGPVAAALDALGMDVREGLHRSVGAIVAAHAFFNVAIVVVVVGGTWAHVDPELVDAAAILGAPGWRGVWRVLVPLARPAIAGAALLVFLFSFTSFGVVLLLGGPTRATIDVEIYRRTTQLLDLSTAAALSVLQLVFVGALLWLGAFVEARAERQTLQPSSAVARAPRTLGEVAFVATTALALAAWFLPPLGTLVVRSLWGPSGFTLERYLELGSLRAGGILAVSPLAAIATSLATSAIAVAVALPVGTLAAAAVARARRSPGLLGLVGLPLGVSAVTVGLGYVVAFDRPPLDLRGSFLALPIAQSIVAIPFVVRTVAPVLSSTASDLAEQAADLGASPVRAALDVTLPIASPALLAGALFAFLVSLGEFGATALLARAGQPTLPVAIARLLGQPGEAAVAQATAMSVVLMAVTAAGALTIERVRVGAFRRF